MLKTSRGLIKYILLTLITLGIYNLYVIYRAAKDANLADTQDKKVGGLIFYIIFMHVNGISHFRFNSMLPIQKIN